MAGQKRRKAKPTIRRPHEERPVSRSDAITLRVVGGETHVSVQDYRLGALQGFRVDSCNACDPVDTSIWPDDLAHAIRGRQRDGGADKGRVLYAFRVRWLQQDLPVAALTYHLDTRLIRIKKVGVRRDSASLFDRAAVALLIDCADELALKHGSDRLEMVVRTDAAFRSAQTNHRFVRVRQNDRRQRELRGEILLERRRNQ